jgi:hypothetical protein
VTLVAELGVPKSPVKLLTLPRKLRTEMDGAFSTGGWAGRSGLGLPGELAAELGAEAPGSWAACCRGGCATDISAALTTLLGTAPWRKHLDDQKIGH